MVPPDRGGITAHRPQPAARETERARRNEAAPGRAEGDVYAQALQAVYGKRVDAIDKSLGMFSSLTRQPRVSTGLLSVDLMLGNGFVPGFHVFFGFEQSAKSTACMQALWSSLQRNIPVRKYFDAEGAIDRRYTGNILQTDSWGDVFGDLGRNGWIKRPRCSYSDSNIIETVFRDMHRTASFMPTKVFREDEGEWFLVFDRTTEQRNLLKEMLGRELLSPPDKALYKSTGHYWCSVGDDDAPQGMFFIDSLPVLEPQKIDEEKMSDAGLAIHSRYLGQYMRLVRGKLRPKGIVLLAVNQLRDRPMPGPGQLNYYEPPATPVKGARHSPSMGTAWGPKDDFPRPKENRGLCEEPSVEFENGTDLYAFKRCSNAKNKLGQPFRKTIGRVWIKDGEGEPRGFDPVYDVYKFLDTVGAVDGPITEVGRKKFFINLKPVAGAEWSWESFKLSVLGHYDGNRRLLHAAREMGAPGVDLRSYCCRLLNSGRTEDMLAAKARTVEKRGGVDLEAEDGEDGE